MGADCDELEAFMTGFEGSGDARRDADRVERTDLHELIVELDLSAATEDHVHLFGADVAM